MDPAAERQIAELKNNLDKADADLRLTRQQLDVTVLAGREKDAKMAEFESQLGRLVQRNTELEAAMDAIKKDRPRMKVTELARQLRSELESLHGEALERSKEGQAIVMVDQLDVEIRGGIDLAEGIALTEPLAQEVTDKTVSTVRIALRGVPAIRIVDESA